MFNRFIPFLYEYKVLTEAQSGFSKGKCIEITVISRWANKGSDNTRQKIGNSSPTGCNGHIKIPVCEIPASSAVQCTNVMIQINKEHTCCCACTILRIVCLEYALDLTSISVKAPFATALMKASLQSATDAVCGTEGSSLFTRLVDCSWNKH